MAYSKPCQTFKMERFTKIVIGQNSVTLEIVWFFVDFTGKGGRGGEVTEVSQLAQNYLILK